MTGEVDYTIRAMAARCRMTVHTLRYYERVGLIQAVERGRNGHHRYSEVDEAWVKFLQFLRATQMPIREIRRYAVTRDKGPTGLAEQRTILENHGRTLEEQIAKLKEAPSCPPLSPRKKKELYAGWGRLLAFEPAIGSAFTTKSQSEL